MARVLLAGVLALGLAGCKNSAPEPVDSPAATTATQFGGTDLAWIEINIAMDEEMLPLLELVPERSGSSDVQALAAQVQAFTNAELSEFRALHDQAGLPAVNPHKGMPMPGMVTPSDVTAAAALGTKEFDALLREHLVAHLEQGRKLAESERTAGVEPRTTALAARISETRQATLSVL